MTPRERLKHHVTGAIERDEKTAIVAMPTLKCSMTEHCTDIVSMIDNRGFIYCKTHGIARKAYCACRRLTKAELKFIKSGQPIRYSK